MLIIVILGAPRCKVFIPSQLPIPISLLTLMHPRPLLLILIIRVPHLLLRKLFNFPVFIVFDLLVKEHSMIDFILLIELRGGEMMSRIPFCVRREVVVQDDSTCDTCDPLSKLFLYLVDADCRCLPSVRRSVVRGSDRRPHEHIFV